MRQGFSLQPLVLHTYCRIELLSCFVLLDQFTLHSMHMYKWTVCIYVCAYTSTQAALHTQQMQLQNYTLMVPKYLTVSVTVPQ